MPIGFPPLPQPSSPPEESENEDRADRQARQLLLWRLESLLGAGYDAESALHVAESHADLHRAADLVKNRGCSPELAVQILT